MDGPRKANEYQNTSILLQKPENVTAAREKFGNQKAISSDQYFGRNNYDSDAQAEASNRLQSFSGATSISSNQYFGRPEEPQAMGSDGKRSEHLCEELFKRVLSVSF